MLDPKENHWELLEGGAADEQDNTPPRRPAASSGSPSREEVAVEPSLGNGGDCRYWLQSTCWDYGDLLRNKILVPRPTRMATCHSGARVARLGIQEKRTGFPPARE